MPAVYLFEKRTILGGDDLQVPALMTIGVRIVQLLLLTLPQCIWMYRESHHDWLDLVLVDPSMDEPCRHSHFFPLLVSMYLAASTAFGMASMILEYYLWWWSCQGTPTDRQPRTMKVETFLEYKVFVFTILLGIIVATYASSVPFASNYTTCRRELQDDYDGDDGGNSNYWIATRPWWAASALLILSQTMEVFLSVLFWTRLMATEDRHGDATPPHNSTRAHELTEELWADRCNSMFQCLSMSTCCLFGGRDLLNNQNNSGPYYEHVARALADLLETKGTLDVVPTDLVTGLLVLQRLQRQRTLQARLHVVRTSQSHLQLRHRASLQQRSGSSEGVPIEEISLGSSSHERHVMRSSSDIASKTTPSTLRSRAGGADLKSNGAFFAHSPAPSSAPTIATNGSGPTPIKSSLDIPETARLVASGGSSPPAVRSILRRCIDEFNDPLQQPPQAYPGSQSRNPRRYYQSQSRAVLNPSNPVDCMRLKEGAHMAKYALSIYTWMLYLFVHPVTGLPRLLCRSCHLCQLCDRRECQNGDRARHASLLDPQNNTIGDNLCSWHKHSLLLVAGLPESDLIYAQFRNRFSFVPYCILLDHATQSVVVSIRGSLSLEDLVTDVHLHPEPVDELGRDFGFEAEGQYCHAGVVACAINVHSDLQRHGLLERLLNHEYPEYRLTLVGHSLGAATCSLLGYMLQPRFPTLRVFNYSPPGGTMTWELATRCESWVTTYVLDNDIVPRLSRQGIEGLRDEVLDLVGRLRVPKYRVVESFWTGSSRRSCLCGTSTTENASQDLEDLNELIDTLLDETPRDTVYQRQLQEFLNVQRERKLRRSESMSLNMYPPGRMIHMLKTGEEGGCHHVMKKIVTCCTTNSGFQYTPVYIANDDLDEIVVSPTMGTDHFIDRIVDEITGIAQEYETMSTLAVGDSEIV